MVNKNNIPQILYELGFGIRSLSLEDFETACEKLNFPFFWTDEKLDDGISFPRERNGRKYHVIVLRKTLFRCALPETVWHEFAHAHYSHYGVRCFARGSEDKFELEANDFALCCIIPTLWVRKKSREELLDEGFTNEQLDRRKEIYDSCGI
jgi:hypothetical protein